MAEEELEVEGAKKSPILKYILWELDMLIEIYQNI